MHQPSAMCIIRLSVLDLYDYPIPKGRLRPPGDFTIRFSRPLCQVVDALSSNERLTCRPGANYCAIMAKKKSTKKTENNPFHRNLDRLGGKKLMQHGAEESSRGKESRKQLMGAGPRRSG